MMVYQALQAAQTLQQENIRAEVINVHTVKPLDTETIIHSAAKTKAVVVCEEHQCIGGLGSAVCEVLSQHCCVPVELVGIQDTFGESGLPDDLMEAYGLGESSIVQAVRNVLKRK